MNDKNEKIKNKKGSALAYGLIIMFAVSIILVSILQFVVSQMKFSIRMSSREQSLQLADAGVTFYRWYLAHKTFALGPKELYEFWESGNVLGVGQATDWIPFPAGNPIGEYKLEVTAPAANSTIAIVKATGRTYKDPNLKREVQVRFRKPSLSEYSVVTNSDIRFGEGTVINGKIHSNGGIRFDGVANNLITSLKETYDDPDHTGSSEFGVHTHKGTIDPLPPSSVPTRSDVFVAGRQFPEPEVSFTGFDEDNLFMKERAKIGVSGNGCSASGCYFDNGGYGRHIIFYANGTMSVRRVTNYDRDTYDVNNRVLYQGLGNIITEDGATTYTIPNSGIIFVEDNAWVEGTINNKKVTVAAVNFSADPTQEANIYLGMNNLLYTNFEGSDIIGLVAEDNIEIIKNSQNNLIIDGSLLAQNGRVGRKYYTCKTWKYDTCTHWHGTVCQTWDKWQDVTPAILTDDVQHCAVASSDDTRSTITVNGSLATKLRYGFAYTDGTGYQTRNLNFDNNLLYYPPPYYPTGNNKGYSVDLWEEL